MPLVVRLLCSSLPVVAFAPLQAPEAAHDVAWVLDHVSVVLPPWARLVALAASVTVGAVGAVPDPAPPDTPP